LKIFAKIFIYSFCILIFISLSSKEVFADNKDLRELRTEHFIIYHHKDVSRSYATQVKNTAERFYRTITQEFRLVRDKPWLWENRAKIFIAKDKEDYLDRFICASWSAACVDYRQKIIYTYYGHKEFMPIFVHELTHIMLREYIGEQNIPLWLDEGVATYMEDKYGGGGYKKKLWFIKKKIAKGEHTKLRELNGVSYSELEGKSNDDVNLFYLESFSIVNFIMNRYGRYKFSNFLRQLEKGYDVEKAFSKIFYNFRTLEDLEKEWKKFYRK